MNKRYMPILIVTGALLLAALAGPLLSAPAEQPPARVLFDNTGGRVIFAHTVHVDDYGLECGECHHDEGDPAKPVPCGACHPASFDESWKHDHPSFFPNKDMCLRCHDSDPSGGVTPDNRPDTDWLPVRADAFHGQCMGCHDSMGGPTGEQECKSCHAGM
ncbi:MAG: cytochrome c3 family protein [Desulfovibrionaceae bacterium]